VWPRVIMAQLPSGAVDPLVTKAVCPTAEVATEAVLAVMGGTAGTAELVVGPVVGAGSVAHGTRQGPLIQGYGVVEMAMRVGQDMADLIIGTASMATL
jgi:hypothetical protein